MDFNKTLKNAIQIAHNNLNLKYLGLYNDKELVYFDKDQKTIDIINVPHNTDEYMVLAIVSGFFSDYISADKPKQYSTPFYKILCDSYYITFLVSNDFQIENRTDDTMVVFEIITWENRKEQMIAVKNPLSIYLKSFSYSPSTMDDFKHVLIDWNYNVKRLGVEDKEFEDKYLFPEWANDTELFSLYLESLKEDVDIKKIILVLESILDVEIKYLKKKELFISLEYTKEDGPTIVVTDVEKASGIYTYNDREFKLRC